MSLFAKEALVAQLKSPSKHVQQWAAYHLVEYWKEEAESFVEALLEADDDIKVFGIHLVGTQKLESFAFPLFRLFCDSEGELRRAATTALAELHYEALGPSLWEHLQQLLASKEYCAIELENTLNGLLLQDSEKYWSQINELLPHYYHNQLISASLFKSLCHIIETPQQLEQLLQHYQVYRKEFADPQFFEQFVDVFDSGILVELLRARKSYGYSIQLMYQECLTILGHPISPELSALLEPIGQGYIEQPMEELCQQLLACLDWFELQGMERVYLEAMQSLSSRWKEAILKNQDQEYFFLLALPLLACLNEAEERCMGDPKKHMDQAIRIYHSPMLRPHFMTRLLETLYCLEKDPRPMIHAISEGFHAPKEVLWRLAIEGLEEESIPIQDILPIPWDYKMPWLTKLLAEHCQSHFEEWVAQSSHALLDYSVTLFRHCPSSAATELVLKYFTLLINQHFHVMFDFIEHQPESCFIEPLAAHYRPGEERLYELLNFVCLVHEKVCPVDLSQESHPDQTMNVRVRLPCSKCHHSYHYEVRTLYYDEERIEQRRPFRNSDLWIPELPSCKNCQASLLFKSDQEFRDRLYADILTLRLLKLRQQEQKALDIFKPLVFPKYFGKKMHPEAFFKKAHQDLKDSSCSEKDEGALLLELGKVYFSIEQFSEALEAFSRCLQGVPSHPEALFYSGMIAFRQKNLYDARLYFSQLVGAYDADDFQSHPENLFELATHYLEVLDHRDVRRSSFQLVRS